jgi:hypothetical protein
MLERVEQLSNAEDKSAMEAKAAEIPVSFVESMAKEKKK